MPDHSFQCFMKAVFEEEVFIDSSVSVIIPVYNTIPYLREALDSVIHQTYPQLEILLIDDGSTDGSAALCDTYLPDPRVQVVHQENRGLSAARNVGIERATGDYIAFLDADDAFRPEMIKEMLAAAQQSRADLVACSHALYWTDGRLDEAGRQGIPEGNGFRYEREESLTSREARRRLLDGRFSCQAWNKLYKRELWDVLRFPEGHVYEDNRVMFDILEACESVYTLPSVCVLHRKRKGSITTTASVQNLQDHILAMQTVDDYVDSRVPEVFTEEDAADAREKHAGAITVLYGKLLYRRTERETMRRIREDIRAQWNRIPHRRARSGALFILFKYAPFLIAPALFCRHRMGQLDRKKQRARS